MWPASSIISGSPTSSRILGHNYGHWGLQLKKWAKFKSESILLLKTMQILIHLGETTNRWMHLNSREILKSESHTSCRPCLFRSINCESKKFQYFNIEIRIPPYLNNLNEISRTMQTCNWRTECLECGVNRRCSAGEVPASLVILSIKTVAFSLDFSTLRSTDGSVEARA